MGDGADKPQVLGVLYLDARYASHTLSALGHDVLHAIARQAASLIENARLVEAEEVARRNQRELAIAARIQQGLMAVTIPKVAFARIHARSIPCKETGGDFFDVIKTADELSVVIADVSGKGIAAAQRVIEKISDWVG